MKKHILLTAHSQILIDKIRNQLINTLGVVQFGLTQVHKVLLPQQLTRATIADWNTRVIRQTSCKGFAKIVAVLGDEDSSRARLNFLQQLASLSISVLVVYDRNLANPDDATRIQDALQTFIRRDGRGGQLELPNLD